MLLENRDFRRLWIGQTISSFGSGITGIALPLAAVLVLAASPAQMGILGALDGLAVIAFGMLAGVWVDRVGRRPLLIASDLGRAAVLGAIPAAALLGWLSMPLLYAAAAGAAVLTILFGITLESYLPTLVPRSGLVRANSRLALSDSLAEVGGPSLAGPLVQLLGAPMVVAVDAISFLVSALGLSLIRAPERRPSRLAPGNGAWRQTVEGLRTLLREPRLRSLAIGGALFNSFGSLVGTLYILYVVRDLHLAAAAVGLLVAAGGASSLAGTLLAARVIRRIGIGPTIGIGLTFYGAVTFLIVLAPPVPWVAAPFLLAAQLGDFSATIHLVAETSLRQAIVSDRTRGRVNAGMRLLTRGFVPAAAVAAGLLGGLIGLRLTIAIGVAGVFGAGIWLLLSPVRTARMPRD
jgi:MFS family permease